MIFNVTNGGGGEKPTSLVVATPPDQTTYSPGDSLDLTGMVVSAVYADGTPRDVTSLCSFNPADGTALSAEGTITITAAWEGMTAATTITVSSLHVYGIYWDGSSSPAWTRTDEAANFADPVPYVSGATSYSSPFDNLMPWKGMVRVTDSEAGELVVIPKFWYKWTRAGDSMKLQIADKATNGFLVSPAHADRGDGKGERDIAYVGRYHCASDYKSMTGSSPKVNITRSAARSGIHNLGSTIWQWDYAMLWTIRMLYLVEFANWNSQSKIGMGCGNGNSIENMGATDNMPYHTGTSKTMRNSYGVGCQYRYIEGLWDNAIDWCDGIYFNGSSVYCIKNPASFSDTSGGTNVGAIAINSGYISEWTNPSASGFEYALYPSACKGSDNSYICDYCDRDGDTVLHVGGNCSRTQNYGLFCMGDDTVSTAWGDFGSRLMKLP